MKITVVQMNTGNDKTANLAAASSLIENAVRTDAPDLIALPEVFPYLGEDAAGRQGAAEDLPGGEAYTMLSELAARHRVFIHGGSLLEKNGDTLFNTTVAFDRDGAELARYRKIHLFDVTTPDGREYRESNSFAKGREVVSYDADVARIGCSICYDLRFPELFQQLARQGSTVIMVPAAFSMATGKDHWEVLLRARAIETQSYVVAPAQWGSYANDKGRASYGHSMIIDPWGHVIARMSDKTGYVTAQLDFDYLQSIRRRIPVGEHKVL